MSMCAQLLQVVSNSVTPWIIAHQAPLSMGLSRQQYRSGLPCPPPGDLPNPGIEPTALTSPVLAGEFFTTSATWEATKDRTKREAEPSNSCQPPAGEQGPGHRKQGLSVKREAGWPSQHLRPCFRSPSECRDRAILS